jgi:hypothetical protein
MRSAYPIANVLDPPELRVIRIAFSLQSKVIYRALAVILLRIMLNHDKTPILAACR